MVHTAFAILIVSIILTNYAGATTITNRQDTASSVGTAQGQVSTSLQNPSPTSVSPDVISRVNNGVSTILQGVRSASLEQILRGSFIFTRNDNVRSVANNVLDNVFLRTGAVQQ